MKENDDFFYQKNMQKYFFEIEMKVRDYECDIQGIVNNAVYQNYLEHTRHEFLLTTGVNFLALHQAGIDPVVSHIEIDYKIPLQSGDDFFSTMHVVKDGIKHVFFHEILRKKDQKLCVKAKVDIVTLINGKLSRGEHLDEILQRLHS